jgi:hypothetical protein
MTTMTPTQKIKWLVLAKAAQWRDEDPPPYPCADVDDLYAAAWEREEIYDAVSEVRCSGEETLLGAGGSRHYEADAIAAQLPDGTWVGWTHWYGGGKHGEPSAVPWMEYAYDVTMREETRVVRVFAKPAADASGVTVGDGHGHDANTGVTHGTGEEG